MADAAHANMLRDLSVEEQGGAIVALHRQFLVTGCTLGHTGALREALDHPGVPQPESRLTYFPNLVLVSRKAQVMDNDPTKVIVDLYYERIARAVFNREEFQFRVTGGTGLNQKQTQFDGFGNQISLSHTFAADDPDWPSADGAQTQGGEVSVLYPTTTLRFEGVLRTAFPHYISSNWANYINAEAWAGGPAGTWLCTDVQFELLDSDNINNGTLTAAFGPVWTFTFEFLYDPGGHNPVAVFNDPRTNRPPPNLVANTGYKVIQWYPSRYFSELFPI